ncbi:MAG: T9SS type A sorting domain-containing protein, partial [Bacteroidota bacterium]
VIAADGAEYVAPVSGFVMRHLGAASVNENLSKLRIDAYPNPATDRLRIDLGSQDAGTFDIELVDAAGRQVIPSHRAVAAVGASTSVWLSTSEIPSGMYSAVIRSNGGVRSVPVAVVR